ncbi:MAG: amino-acid N-acetyltransferase [Verrucomicrobia bacterium]|nr:amino-acid N-acetyltransferase [Verrucomicrobiota bacterium]
MKASDLRGILTYIPSFRDKLFVLSVDSAVLEDERAASLFLDISVLRSLNIRVVLVHGASARIKKMATEMKLKPTNLDGLGVTDEDTLKVSERAANSYSHDILQSLADADLRGAVTNAIIAHPAGILGGVDQQWTGRVERVDTRFLEALLENGIIPVIPPMGVDGDGRTYRVNSDGVALEVAEALKAEKLIFLTGGGELPMNGKKPAQLSVEEASEWLKKKKGELSGVMASKLEHGLRACREGVSRAHILNGLEDDALLEELFSSEGVGTMIYADEYTEIRKALKKDVRSIMRLIGNSVASEELVRRTRGEVAAAIGDYSVFEIDGNMVGCVALHGLEGKTAEMGCLFVASGHENAGIGRKLMLYAENRAKEMGMKRLLALSTQAFNYLQSKGGFNEGTVDMLPAARKTAYEASGRNSKILYKDLT